MKLRFVAPAAALLVAAAAWVWWARPGAPPAVAPSALGPQLSGQVVLAPQLAAQVRPEDTVFIFAQVLDGPRMPVAQLKRRAAELPLQFTLDERSAVNPAPRLSPSMQIVVSVLVSRSGQVTAQAGDLQGQSAPVPVGTQGLAIEIDRVLK